MASSNRRRLTDEKLKDIIGVVDAALERVITTNIVDSNLFNMQSQNAEHGRDEHGVRTDLHRGLSLYRCSSNTQMEGSGGH